MKNKSHHYITESYQKNFSDDNGKIWVLTRESKIFNTNPENTFKEGHFYTVKLPGGGGSLMVEKTLADIEGGFSTTVKNKIEKELELNDEERLYIAAFVSAMLNRTKIQREHFRKSFQNLISRMEEMKEGMKNDKYPKFPLERSEGPSITLEELKEEMEDFDSYESIQTISLMQDFAPIIFKMKWSILVAPVGKKFILSDNPLCMCSPEREKKYGIGSFGADAGFAHKDVELTCPLSKKYALFATWENNHIGYVQAPVETVEQVNYRTSRTAQSIIADSRLSLEEFLKENTTK